MAAAIARQPSNVDERMILMRIRGVVAQIKRREALYRQGEGSDLKNFSTAADLYGRIERLTMQLGLRTRRKADKALSTLGSIPAANPYSPPAWLRPTA